MMQLILETEPGDIRTNMSLEVETLTNSDVNELKHDLLANKENTLKNDNIITNSGKDVGVIAETEDEHNLNTNSELNVILLENNSNVEIISCTEKAGEKVIENGVCKEKEIEDMLTIPIIEEMDIDEVSDVLNNETSPSIKKSENDGLKPSQNDKEVEDIPIQNLEKEVKSNDFVSDTAQDCIVPDNIQLENDANLKIHSEGNSTNGICLSFIPENINVECAIPILGNLERMVASPEDSNKNVTNKELEALTNNPCAEKILLEDEFVTAADVNHDIGQDIIANTTMTAVPNKEESFAVNEEDLKKKAGEIADSVICMESDINADKPCDDKVEVAPLEVITTNQVTCVETSNQPLVMFEESEDIAIEAENNSTDNSKSIHCFENTVVSSNYLDSELIGKDTIKSPEHKDNVSSCVPVYDEIITENLVHGNVNDKLNVSVENNADESNKLVSGNNMSEDISIDIQENSVRLTENFNSLNTEGTINSVSEVSAKINDASHTKQDIIISASQEKMISVDFECRHINEGKESDEISSNLTTNEQEILDANVSSAMDVDLSDEVDMNTNENVCENNKNELTYISNEKATPKNESSPIIICDDKHGNEMMVDLDREDSNTQAPMNNFAETLYDSEKITEIKSNENIEVIDEDDIKIIEDDDPKKTEDKEKNVVEKQIKALPVVCKLSNTLDILSEEEEEEPAKVDSKNDTDISTDKQCIAIDDDDDIMLIEEDSNHKESNVSTEEYDTNKAAEKELTEISNISPEPKVNDNEKTSSDILNSAPKINEKVESTADVVENEPILEKEIVKPLLPETFLTTAKKNLAEMSRNELEDFCILKIVESIVDRSGLGEIKNHMKAMAQNLEEYRKKAIILTKQNRDLQVVLKSVQEEQKKRTNVIQPLKITRSVGMQVLMTEKLTVRRQGLIPSQTAARPRVQNKTPNKPNIPFPRLVPANNSAANKTALNSAKAAAIPNGIKTPSPAQKQPEKRTQSRINSTSSITVDLTDDEPPAKIKAKNNPVPPVRLVSPQSLMPPQKTQFSQNHSSPRKVYIPISCPQTPTVRPGQAVMLKTLPNSGPTVPRPRGPGIQAPRAQASSLKLDKILRHPAPLPDAMKQYTPPTWKPLPPAPEMKLAKSESGIIISWKIERVPENSYETIASYQLYAYQETTSSPSTSLWKKIGDVKALPLPMACTLTQFMASYKYYFAVRAVDIRSRLGPFSVPGSILLLSTV